MAVDERIAESDPDVRRHNKEESVNFKWFLHSLLVMLAILPAAEGYGSGQATFDSLGGDYDEQTGFEFEKTLYYAARARTIVGKLSAPGQGGAMATEKMRAGGGERVDGLIRRKRISAGDMVRYTLQEHAKGLGTFGDNLVKRGQYLAYQNMEVRVNTVSSPGFPIVGKNAQRRVKHSISNIPAAVRKEAMIWHAEDDDWAFMYTLLAGASPNVLASLEDGGLEMTLGVNSSGTAGRLLMPKNVYTPQAGYLTDSYSTTPATWNSTVNDAINAIDPTANGRITLVKLDILRSLIDDENWAPATVQGKQYKCVWLCDSELWYRINHLLRDYYVNARERGADNPVFGVNHSLEYNEMLFINVPRLKKLRPSYSSANGYPTLGPGYSQDFRTYTNTSKISPMIGITDGCVCEGFDDKMWVTDEEAAHKKGMEVAAHRDSSYVRGEWYAKDGRTDVDAVYSKSVFLSLFYEDGVGNGY